MTLDSYRRMLEAAPDEELVRAVVRSYPEVKKVWDPLITASDNKRLGDVVWENFIDARYMMELQIAHSLSGNFSWNHSKTLHFMGQFALLGSTASQRYCIVRNKDLNEVLSGRVPRPGTNQPFYVITPDDVPSPAFCGDSIEDVVHEFMGWWSAKNTPPRR